MYAISASGKTHKRRDCVPHAPTLWVICYAQMTLSSICSVKGHALTQMASQCILRSKASPGKPLLFRTIPDHRRNLHAERGRFRRFPLQKGGRRRDLQRGLYTRAQECGRRRYLRSRQRGPYVGLRYWKQLRAFRTCHVSETYRTYTVFESR